MGEGNNGSNSVQKQCFLQHFSRYFQYNQIVTNFAVKFTFYLFIGSHIPKVKYKAITESYKSVLFLQSWKFLYKKISIKRGVIQKIKVQKQFKNANVLKNL